MFLSQRHVGTCKHPTDKFSIDITCKRRYQRYKSLARGHCLAPHQTQSVAEFRRQKMSWLLVAGFTVACILFFAPNPPPIFGKYQVPGPRFWLKYLVFRALLLLRKVTAVTLRTTFWGDTSPPMCFGVSFYFLSRSLKKRFVNLWRSVVKTFAGRLHVIYNACFNAVNTGIFKCRCLCLTSIM